MKTKPLALLFAAAALAALPSAHAQSRNNFFENLRRTVVRAPLNTSATVTRTTPAGTVTVATQNTFNGTSGTFATNVTLPDNRTASVAGTIAVTPGTGATVTGSVTGPGGQTTTFTNTATPTPTGVTITSTVTPPNGNTMTNTRTLTPPDDGNSDNDDTLFARLLKRLRVPVPPRG